MGARIKLAHALLDQPGIKPPQVFEPGDAEGDLLDGAEGGILRPPAGDGDLMVLGRIATEEGDVDPARRASAIGDDEAEDARIERDHRFQIEGVEADMTQLAVRQVFHREALHRRAERR